MQKAIIPYHENLAFREDKCICIEKYKWLKSGYEPLVNVFLCHNNERMAIKMLAFENEITTKEMFDDGRIWCDSCLEFFVKPYENDKRYINFEINPNGAMIMSIGENRYERTSIVSKYKPLLNIKATQGEEHWKVYFEIPFTMLREIFDNDILHSGCEMRGNFYKCGDETPKPHYGMWNEIDVLEPDFHLPAFFGALILE